MEEWRPVVGYERLYEVSDQGRIRSLDKQGRDGRSLKARTMKQKYRDDGYMSIMLTGEKRRTIQVHRLVAEAFIPNPGAMPYVRHRDDDKVNNSAENLFWGTHWDNTADRQGFTEHSGRLNTCSRGHALEAWNCYKVARGVQCRACRRAGSCEYNRGVKGEPLTISRDELADIYYIAGRNGHMPPSGNREYTIEDLEVKYGDQAKEWRSTRSSYQEGS